jgi:hypothetical protein
MRPGSFFCIVKAEEKTMSNERISMNHLVFLDAQAGELEKILSGVKTMLVKEFDLVHAPAQPVHPGDNLYFLRNTDECTLRVKATVVRVLLVTNDFFEGLSQTLKEMQSKLQLTECQFNDWSAKQQALLVEFDSAHKIDVIHVTADKIPGRSDWIPFEAFSLITEQRVSDKHPNFHSR